MPLVDRNVNGLADSTSRVMQAGTHVRQLHEIAEIFGGGVATTVIEVAHKWRAVGWHQYRPLAANDGAALRVSGMLCVLRWR